jgi:hypothetical protein
VTQDNRIAGPPNLGFRQSGVRAWRIRHDFLRQRRQEKSVLVGTLGGARDDDLATYLRHHPRTDREVAPSQTKRNKSEGDREHRSTQQKIGGGNTISLKVNGYNREVSSPATTDR